MAQAIDKELNSLISHLTLSQKRSILAVIKSFLPKEKDASIDLVEYNKEIDEALARVNSGNFTSHDDLEKKAAIW